MKLPTNVIRYLVVFPLCLFQVSAADRVLNIRIPSTGNFATFRDYSYFTSFEIEAAPGEEGEDDECPSVALDKWGQATIQIDDEAHKILRWSYKGESDQGYLLMPAQVRVATSNNSEQRFKAKTGGDFKNELQREIRGRLFTDGINADNVSKASKRLAEAEEILTRLGPLGNGEPGPTERYFVLLLKDIGDEAVRTPFLGQAQGSVALASDVLLKAVTRSSKFSTAEMYKILGDSTNLWITFQDKHRLRGSGSANWGSFKVAGQPEVFADLEAGESFERELFDILRAIQGNYTNTTLQAEGLKNRIARNRSVRGLVLLEKTMQLNLSDEQDRAVVQNLQLAEVEQMFDSMRNILTPASR